MPQKGKNQGFLYLKMVKHFSTKKPPVSATRSYPNAYHFCPNMQSVSAPTRSQPHFSNTSILTSKSARTIAFHYRRLGHIEIELPEIHNSIPIGLGGISKSNCLTSYLGFRTIFGFVFCQSFPFKRKHHLESYLKKR